MLRRIVSTRQFALADLALVSLSGILWILRPESGILPILLIALIPVSIRLMAGLFPFRRTPLDALVVIFLVTAWVGYWAAYDQAVAWRKAWLIVLAVLLFYALAGQTQENLEWVCLLLFCGGVSVSLYFLLTHDFLADPRKVEMANRVGRWIMAIRPTVEGTPIHPNYVAGIAAITTPFVSFPAVKLVKEKHRHLAFLSLFLVSGVAIVLIAIFLSTSRGVIMAIASAIGTGIVWWIVDVSARRLQFRREVVFPVLVLISLGAIVFVLFIGPANSAGDISGNYHYGSGSRAELLRRSLYLASDFPFTGGGLASFAGLYSHYMLGIPFLNVSNSHNLFLDVGIEQGLLGGFSYLMIILVSIWSSARAIARTDSTPLHLFGWLTYLTLIIAFIHGMVDDYLYNASGTILSLVLAGSAMTLQTETVNPVPRRNFFLPGLVTLLFIGFFVMNPNRVRSAWYADLGAVEMAKAELVGFPTGQWTDPSILPALEATEASLHVALQADPSNRTANHRLGLILMLRGDFRSAVVYLEEAKRQAPNHRGIIKSLGYCYVWLGEMGKAQLLLSEIPEADEELGVYVWWWEAQGRDDLSANASLMHSRLSSASQQ